MKVVVAGATGFIGTALVPRLLGAGHLVTTLSRDPERARGKMQGAGCLRWDGRSLDNAATLAVAEADGVVNLAGAPIAGRRWSAAYREQILASRVQSTRALVGAMLAGRRPGAV